MLETATDVGFLWVDADRSVVLVEGGGGRWAVRGADVASCYVEKLKLGYLVDFLVVIEVKNAALGWKERCIASRRGGITLLGRNRRKWAGSLAAAIDEVRGSPTQA